PPSIAVALLFDCRGVRSSNPWRRDSATMESRSSAELVVSGLEEAMPFAVVLTGARLTVGRLPDENDVALAPDPQRLVSRVAHCVFEREGSGWLVADGGGVNGTFLRRGGRLDRVSGRVPLRDGDVVCVLAATDEDEGRRYFELAFHSGAQDSEATRAAG